MPDENNSIKVISFDMDGTLVTEDFDNKIWMEELPAYYAKEKGITVDEAKGYVFSKYKEHEGNDSWTSLEFWFNMFGLKDWQSLLIKNEHLIKIYPETESVLKELQNYFILIVTTQAPKAFFDLKMKGLEKYFKKIYSSTHHFGKLKKDKVVFEKILKDFNIKPEEIIHIGNHKYYDYDVPKELGIKTFFLDRKSKHNIDGSVKDLREFVEKII
jgi:putative hydrolase of the HAD superfamily